MRDGVTFETFVSMTLPHLRASTPNHPLGSLCGTETHARTLTRCTLPSTSGRNVDGEPPKGQATRWQVRSVLSGAAKAASHPLLLPAKTHRNTAYPECRKRRGARMASRHAITNRLFFSRRPSRRHRCQVDSPRAPPRWVHRRRGSAPRERALDPGHRRRSKPTCRGLAAPALELDARCAEKSGLEKEMRLTSRIHSTVCNAE